MGVMACNRKDCTSILCKRYSAIFGYICNECFEEMKESGLDIETFMATPKGKFQNYDYDKEFD